MRREAPTAEQAAERVPDGAMPPASARPLGLVVTDLVVAEPTAEGPARRERAPGRTDAEILAARAAPLILPPSTPEMSL